MKNIYLLALVMNFQLLQGENTKVVKIPEARLKMLDGEYAQLSDFNNDGPVIINFWTTWWPFCERQLAYLDQLNTSFSNTGLKVLSINVNEPKILNLVKPYVSKRKYKFDVSIDPRGKLADKLSVEGIPTLFFADKNGTILYRSSGYEDGYENEYLKELIKYLDKENIPYDDFKFKDKASRRKEAIVDIDF